MKIKTIMLGVLFSFFAVTAMAGSGDDHGHSHSSEPVNQETAKTRAAKVVSVLVENSKLDESWALTTVSSVE